MTKAEQKVVAPSFTKEDLIKNADALGYKSEVVAGALYGVKADTLTKAELKAAVEAFLKKPVGKEGK